MKVIDVHGKRVHEVEALFNELLDAIRMERGFEEVTFITGRGYLQARLKELAELNQLNHYVPLGQGGRIVVEFE